MAKQLHARTRLNSTAVTIGAGLGALAAKVEAWRRQRDEIAAELKDTLAATRRLLADLGHTATPMVPAVIEPVPSDTTRARMRAAWPSRTRQGARLETDPRTKPSDLRATVRAMDGKRWTARQQGRG